MDSENKMNNLNAQIIPKPNRTQTEISVYHITFTNQLKF